LDQKQYQNHLNAFFKLYELFLLVDSVISILDKGRDRQIVIKFLLYFTSIVNKKELEISTHKKQIKKILRNYLEKNSQIINNCNTFDLLKKNSYCDISIEIDINLNNSFKTFLEASKMYGENRQKLTQQEIIDIYKRNAFDYYLTAFGSDTQDGFKAFLDTYTVSKQVNGVRLLKQSLMEFNNAIAHLYSAWKKSSVDKNLERAQQHFNRGALDFYKSIIKELSMLGKIDTSNLEALKQLRCSEYSTIGEERHKEQSLYNKYYDFCSEIVGS
jgi:hypothetical protein